MKSGIKLSDLLSVYHYTVIAIGLIADNWPIKPLMTPCNPSNHHQPT